MEWNFRCLVFDIDGNLLGWTVISVWGSDYCLMQSKPRGYCGHFGTETGCMGSGHMPTKEKWSAPRQHNPSNCQALEWISNVLGMLWGETARGYIFNRRTYFKPMELCLRDAFGGKQIQSWITTQCLQESVHTEIKSRFSSMTTIQSTAQNHVKVTWRENKTVGKPLLECKLNISFAPRNSIDQLYFDICNYLIGVLSHYSLLWNSLLPLCVLWLNTYKPIRSTTSNPGI